MTAERVALELECDYTELLTGYKAALRISNKLGGANNSCSGVLGILAEARAVLDFGSELARACEKGWDFLDKDGNRVSVKASHVYKDARYIYLPENADELYKDVCVYFWNDDIQDLELLYKGSVKSALDGLTPNKRGKSASKYSVSMRKLKELADIP
ncbi:MAG: hypothetical protein COW18_13830 [Zetaproteobacteria bacterium CG12_big_fil_rev_8_21_14_0_65_54_13]|nr:MAG: hypothetical protein COW18_13830 [Zetaproteobacteria bacterium CG12_big_fil_rev_8_21_14_0_65_54_13]PJA31217.1 MAG: hypothetical protein CO188_00005 [Zetaproteobacteria bacterium CG_4_9_14_3_um_filter_54_145]